MKKYKILKNITPNFKKDDIIEKNGDLLYIKTEQRDAMIWSEEDVLTAKTVENSPACFEEIK